MRAGVGAASRELLVEHSSCLLQGGESRGCPQGLCLDSIDHVLLKDVESLAVLMNTDGTERAATHRGPVPHEKMRSGLDATLSRRAVQHLYYGQQIFGALRT